MRDLTINETILTSSKLLAAFLTNDERKVREAVTAMHDLFDDEAEMRKMVREHLTFMLRHDSEKCLDFLLTSGLIGVEDTADDTKGGNSLLIEAQKHLASKVTRKLLEYGANLDRLCSEGSALHMAVKENHVEGVRELIGAGANVRLKDKDGNTPSSLIFGLKGETYEEMWRMLFLQEEGVLLKESTSEVFAKKARRKI